MSGRPFIQPTQGDTPMDRMLAEYELIKRLEEQGLPRPMNPTWWWPDPLPATFEETLGE